jgi:hypothetical protein
MGRIIDDWLSLFWVGLRLSIGRGRLGGSSSFWVACALAFSTVDALLRYLQPDVVPL